MSRVDEVLVHVGLLGSWQSKLRNNFVPCKWSKRQPRTQALSSMRRREGKTLVGAGHVIDQILIA